MSASFYPKLPNIRELFLPDPEHIICDVDLDRADLQVVVWEADDADLKRRLRMGVDLHIVNGIEIKGGSLPSEDELVPSHPKYPEHARRYAKERKAAKAFVHGTNYGGSARTMAINTGVTVREAEIMQKRWFGAHPGIKRWHERVEEQLFKTRTVTNAFGFRRFYFDRIEGLLPEALAWVPQSTVAHVTNTAILNIHENLPQVKLLLQVHDSLVFQYHRKYDPAIRPKIREQCLIPVPYDDPLIIPVGLAISERSWGEVKEAPWD